MKPRAYCTFVLAVTGLSVNGGTASAQELQTVPAHAINVGASLNLSARYIFRGYEQDHAGAVVQPGITVARDIYSSAAGLLRSVEVSIAAWSSLHANTRSYPNTLGWYEADVSAGITATLPNDRSIALGYVAYLAPTDAFPEVHEIALSVGLGTFGDESNRAISPTILIAREVFHSGGPQATYLELGSDIELLSTGTVAVSTPVTVGLSLDGYYLDAEGGNEPFGFVTAGLVSTTDLVPSGLGDHPGKIRLGLDVTRINENARLAFQANTRWYWNVHIGLEFEL